MYPLPLLPSFSLCAPSVITQARIYISSSLPSSRFSYFDREELPRGRPPRQRYLSVYLSVYPTIRGPITHTQHSFSLCRAFLRLFPLRSLRSLRSSFPRYLRRFSRLPSPRLPRLPSHPRVDSIIIIAELVSLRHLTHHTAYSR